MRRANRNASLGSVAVKMPRGKDTSRGLSVLQKFSRGRKLVGLVPRVNAQSDVESSSSDEEDAAQQYRRYSYSSEAPSISSSLERLNLLGEESDEEVNICQADESFVSRMVRGVAVDDEPSYNNVPSLTSILSVDSPTTPKTKRPALDIASNLSCSPEPAKDFSAMPSPAKSVVGPLPEEPSSGKPLAVMPLPSKPVESAELSPAVPSPDVPALPEVPSTRSKRKANTSKNNMNVLSPAVGSFSAPSPAVPSPAVQDMSRVPRTRSKRKADTTVTNITQKRRKIVAPVNYKWKKGTLKSKADIEQGEFIFPMDKNSPLDYFGKYFSTDIMQDIVLNTNLYSVQCKGKSMNFTEDELKDFISIMLIMGIVVMPAYTDYWSTKSRYPEAADVMSLKKFEQIRRFIHFADNTSTDSDRYFKVRPLVEKIRQNCLKTEEEMRYSVDEMTIPYKGKKAGNRKQYNPMKPDKWGFKCIVRAGMSGIVYDFLLYGGDDTFRFINFTAEEEHLTLGAKMVVALCKTIQTRACVVYFDNFFATLDLGRHLRDSYGIFSLGTIRQNRLKGCASLLMSDKDMKKKGRGTFSQMVDNEHNLAVVKWFDNKVVTLVSSYTDAYPVQTIKRYSKEVKAKIDVDCPQLVKHYNQQQQQQLGGVDLCDMLIALYRTTFKSRRWYTGIFAQMLDICVNNAWLLYRRDCARQGASNMNLKTFRWTLAKELQQNGRIRKSQVVPADNNNVPIIQAPAKPRPVDSVRYDTVGHWQDFTTQGRCKYCKNNITDVICTKCNLRLCLVRKRNCFYKFHNN